MVAIFLNQWNCKVAFSLLLNIYIWQVLPNVSGLIGLFLFVGDVIASRTSSTTSLIPHDLAYISLSIRSPPLSLKHFVSLEPFSDSL